MQPGKVRNAVGIDIDLEELESPMGNYSVDLFGATRISAQTGRAVFLHDLCSNAEGNNLDYQDKESSVLCLSGSLFFFQNYPFLSILPSSPLSLLLMK